MYLSPDKRNIKYVVKKVANDIEMAMTWLVDGLVDLGNKFPRTLVYCKSISDVAKIYDYVMDESPEEINSYVAMYHSETDESIKGTALSSIREEESPTRVIISTNALGMGVDLKAFLVLFFLVLLIQFLTFYKKLAAQVEMVKRLLSFCFTILIISSIVNKM